MLVDLRAPPPLNTLSTCQPDLKMVHNYLSCAWRGCWDLMPWAANFNQPCISFNGMSQQGFLEVPQVNRTRISNQHIRQLPIQCNMIAKLTTVHRLPYRHNATVLGPYYGHNLTLSVLGPPTSGLTQSAPHSKEKFRN